jgi:hypothetical protein
MLIVVEWKTSDKLFDFLDPMVVQCYKELMKHVNLFGLKKNQDFIWCFKHERILSNHLLMFGSQIHILAYIMQLIIVDIEGLKGHGIGIIHMEC